MIEYRQYAPTPDMIPQLRVNVAMELSRQASESGDPDEFYVEALLSGSDRPSKNGGTWVYSYLDRPIKAEYADPLYSAPYKVPVPFAQERKPVDMTPEQLVEHLQKKAVRR